MWCSRREWWPITTSTPIDALLTEVPGDVRERGKLLHASSTSEMRDVLGDPDRVPPVTDELRLKAAIAGLARDPEFITIHFTEFDQTQHDASPSSPAALAALARTDHHIGELLGELAQRKLRDGATIVIAHGFTPLHTAVFSGRLFQANGLLGIGDDGLVTQWSAYPWPGGGALAI